MVKLAEAVCFVVAESVTVTVKVYVPAAVGLPESIPVGLSASPVGRLPEVTAKA
jgi:hypothetical protein